MLSNQVANATVIKKSDSFRIGFCKCGCETEIPNLRTGKGLLHLYAHGHNRKGKKHPNYIPKIGPEHGMWKGGKTLSNGYPKTRLENHPKSEKHGKYVPDHVIVMEAYLGRHLRKGEVVHHKDENTENNDISNLQLMTRSEHISHHHLGRHIDTSNRVCFECGSDKTYIKQPYIRNKTPYPLWLHLPGDKENWYCSRCYQAIKKKSKIRNPICQ